MLKLKSHRTTEKTAAAAQTKVTPTCTEYRNFQEKKKSDCSKRKNEAPRASRITEEGITFLL